MKTQWAAYTLDFKFLARTSRQSMTHKDTYIVRVPRADGQGFGYGEAALFRGLSADDKPDYESVLAEACRGAKVAYSSIIFGFESALIDAGHVEVPTTPFLRGEEGIPINGLIWMGDKEEMRRRIDAKLDDGFRVLKLKIGGIDFESELSLLSYIRKRYDPATLELRLDANGSMSATNALEKLKQLSQFAIHSIEQPIKAGQIEAMASICAQSPIDIALDEELIGTPTRESASSMLDVIRPQYIILKPALCGGLSGADLWADLAEERKIGWWATSALESNIGLKAIAAWTARRGVAIPQGLGTGQLYSNNIPSGLELRGDRLYYNHCVNFELPDLQWNS